MIVVCIKNLEKIQHKECTYQDSWTNTTYIQDFCKTYIMYQDSWTKTKVDNVSRLLTSTTYKIDQDHQGSWTNTTCIMYQNS